MTSTSFPSCADSFRHHKAAIAATAAFVVRPLVVCFQLTSSHSFLRPRWLLGIARASSRRMRYTVDDQRCLPASLSTSGSLCNALCSCVEPAQSMGSRSRQKTAERFSPSRRKISRTTGFRSSPLTSLSEEITPDGRCRRDRSLPVDIRLLCWRDGHRRLRWPLPLGGSTSFKGHLGRRVPPGNESVPSHSVTSLKLQTTFRKMFR